MGVSTSMKFMRRKIVAHAFDDAVAQQQRLLHHRPPQVEIAVLQPQFFVRHVLRVRIRRHGRREALVEQLEPGDPQLHLARGQLRVGHPGRPLGHLARHLDHILGPQRLALVDDRLRRIGRIEHDLRHAVPIAQVDKQPAAMVAVAVDPAAERGFLTNMFATQFAARVSSQHRLFSSMFR